MYMSYDESIGQLTNQTNKKIMRYLNSKLELYDITLEQWNVLLKLSQQDKINQKQLAQKVDKDQPTLARILDILERKRLVERLSSKEDKRAFILHITDNGLKLKNEVAPLLENIFEIMISGISNEEVEVYKNVLMKISSNIEVQEKGEK
ncbi:MAG: MarR family transcriptional regulator [Bacillota bacterium]|nr:MarR family transcriptional regulator [Bacillota bacterium]